VSRDADLGAVDPERTVDLTVRTEAGEGTTFTVSIPLAASPPSSDRTLSKVWRRPQAGLRMH
jgi:hypothetical protein